MGWRGWECGCGVGEVGADLGGGPLFCCRVCELRGGRLASYVASWLAETVAFDSFSRVGWLVSGVRLMMGSWVDEVWMTLRAAVCAVGG